MCKKAWCTFKVVILHLAGASLWRKLRPIIRTAAIKSQAKINYWCLTEINSYHDGLSLMRTLTQGPRSVRCKGSWLYNTDCFFCRSRCRRRRCCLSSPLLSSRNVATMVKWSHTFPLYWISYILCLRLVSSKCYNNEDNNQQVYH